MIRWRIQIGDGAACDTYDKWGLIPLSSDLRLAAPLKESDSVSYAEESGEHADTRAVKAAFDFKARFALQTLGGNKHVNALIAAFNDAVMIRRGDSDVYDKQIVTLIDDKHRKIVGIAQPIGSEPETFYVIQGEEVAVVEFTIRVTDPDACNFDLYEGIGEMIVGQNFTIN